MTTVMKSSMPRLPGAKQKGGTRQVKAKPAGLAGSQRLWKSKAKSPKSTSTRATKDAAVKAEREMWYPGAVAPAHLDGTMLGDYGFDPLRLGANANLLPWFREAELMNGRWAMMATLGILFTDAFGIGPIFTEAGVQDYGIPLPQLLAIEVVVMGYLEYCRFKIFEKTGECGLLGFGPWDPAKLRSEETKLKELKNGRLAMMAFLGMVSQAAVTGMGPVECLKMHIQDPGKVNIYTSSVGPEITFAIVVACLAPTVIEAFKKFSDDDEEFRPIPF